MLFLWITTAEEIISQPPLQPMMALFVLGMRQNPSLERFQYLLVSSRIFFTSKWPFLIIDWDKNPKEVWVVPNARHQGKRSQAKKSL